MEFWNKEVDFKYPDSPYWKAEKREGKKVHYTNALVNHTDGVVVIPERLGAGIESLKRLGLVRGFTPFALLKDISERRIEVIKNNSLSGMLKQVLTGRSDGAYINIDIARYQMRERFRNADALIFDSQLPHVKGSYLMSTIKYPKVTIQFNQFLLDERVMIQKMKEQYGLVD